MEPELRKRLKQFKVASIHQSLVSENRVQHGKIVTAAGYYTTNPRRCCFCIKEGGVCEVYRWKCLVWHDFHTKFYCDQFTHQSNIKVIISTVWEVVVLRRIIDGRDLWSTSLRWHQRAWYSYEVREDRFKHSSNVKVLTSTTRGATVLVLLTGGIYELRRWDGLRWHFTENFTGPRNS
jgi:hypothetical protein